MVDISDRPPLILITGIMAAGKSTVAQQLAERLPRSVHLRGDVFRRMIVGGRAGMDLALSPEAEAQLRLRQHIATAVARLYLASGFTVVYQDILIGSDLAAAVMRFRDEALHVVVLCPKPEAVATREAGRGKTGYHTFSVADFDRVFRTETPRLGLWLDSSNFTVAETVDAILARLDEAKIGTVPNEPREREDEAQGAKAL